MTIVKRREANKITGKKYTKWSFYLSFFFFGISVDQWGSSTHVLAMTCSPMRGKCKYREHWLYSPVPVQSSPVPFCFHFLTLLRGWVIIVPLCSKNWTNALVISDLSRKAQRNPGLQQHLTHKTLQAPMYIILYVYMCVEASSML